MIQQPKNLESHDTELRRLPIPRKPIPPSSNGRIHATSQSIDWSQRPQDRERSVSTPLLTQNEEFTGIDHVNAGEIDNVSRSMTGSSKQRQQHRLASYFKRPRGQVTFLFCIFVTLIIFLINLVVSLWAAVRYGIGDGLVAVYNGDCNKVRATDTWIHLLINIFATILLGASNHVMQQICAPSRSDVNQRHLARRHFTIGSIDLLNLGGRRFLVYMLWLASSLPIHLLYNSILISTDTKAQWSSYQVLTTDAQITSIMGDNSIPNMVSRDVLGFMSNPTSESPYQADSDSLVKWIYNSSPKLQRLNVSQCILAYATTENRVHGDALIVATGKSIEYSGGQGDPPISQPSDYRAYQLSSPENFLFDEGSFELANGADYGTAGPFDWMCSTDIGLEPPPGRCDAEVAAPDGHWNYWNNEVGYCLSRLMPASCELNLSLPIALAVLICNTRKLVAMALAFCMRREEVLLTVGDAIASFLREPEASELYEALPNRTLGLIRGFEVLPAEKKKCRDYSWAKYAKTCALLSNLINFVLLVLCGLSFSSTVAFIKNLAGSAQNIPWKSQLFWGTGIGSVPMLTSASPLGGSGLLSLARPLPRDTYLDGVLIANAPQLCVSFVYLCNNALLTNLFKAREWNSYGWQRRGLRVSAPQKGTVQRSTFFLTFPLKWSIPFMAFMAVAHWFVSQTVFLTRTYATYPGGEAAVTQIGASPIGLLCCLVATLIFFPLGLGVTLWPQQWYAPPTSGNSMVISRACHPLSAEPEAHLNPIQFGALSMDESGRRYYCSMSSGPAASIMLRGKRVWTGYPYLVGYVEHPLPPTSSRPLSR